TPRSGDDVPSLLLSPRRGARRPRYDDVGTPRPPDGRRRGRDLRSPQPAPRRPGPALHRRLRGDARLAAPRRPLATCPLPPLGAARWGQQLTELACLLSPLSPLGRGERGRTTRSNSPTVPDRPLDPLLSGWYYNPRNRITC